MKSEPRLAASAAKALLEDDVEGAEQRPEERARTIDVIRGALDARARRQARARVLGRFAVAAGFVLAIGVGAWAVKHTTGAPVVASGATSTSTSAVAAIEGARSLRAERVDGNVEVEHPAGRAPLAAGGEAKLGERVSTRQGSAELALVTGTHLLVEGDTTLDVVQEGSAEVVRLDHGSVVAKVAKVKPGARFLVRAEGLEVEVRGTMFRVTSRPSAGCGVASRVDVTEGRVAVRAADRELVLGAGESWSSACASGPGTGSAAEMGSAPVGVAAAAGVGTVGAGAPTGSAPTGPGTGLAARPPHAPPPAPPAPPPTALAAAATAAPLPASELAAQNALFAEAMAAKARGDEAGALAKLDAFVGRYPQSPLGEAVATQRLRIALASDPARAPRIASEYLARYPQGIARAEAEAALAKR